MSANQSPLLPTRGKQQSHGCGDRASVTTAATEGRRPPGFVFSARLRRARSITRHPAVLGGFTRRRLMRAASLGVRKDLLAVGAA